MGGSISKADLKGMSTSEVSNHLKGLGCNHYADIVLEKNLNGEFFARFDLLQVKEILNYPRTLERHIIEWNFKKMCNRSSTQEQLIQPGVRPADAPPPMEEIPADAPPIAQVNHHDDNHGERELAAVVHNQQDEKKKKLRKRNMYRKREIKNGERRSQRKKQEKK